MRCTRCDGLMVEDYGLELDSDEENTRIEAWRCLNCGHIVDPVIIQNRQAGQNTTSDNIADSHGFLWFLSVTVSFLGPLLAEGVSRAQEEPEFKPYVSAYLVRSQPTGGNYFYLEDHIPSLTVESGTGGGAKLGAYIHPFSYALGLELEAFAHDGKLSAPHTTQGGVTRFANQGFTMVNVMGNLLLRYPGDLLQPYVGGGVGLAWLFTHGEVQSKGGLQSGSHGLSGFAAQAIAGTRLVLTEHIFMFAEYKYLVASMNLDHCSDQDRKAAPCPVLNELHDFATHYMSVGIGFSLW